MTDQLDSPPPNIKDEIAALEAALKESIPKQTDNNLLIATWNIRAFSSLTRKWTSGGNDSPKRDFRGLRAIIAILRKFDVIAIQEVKGNIRALRDTLKFLGEDWSFLMTDVTLGDSGNGERLAYMYNTRRIKASGLACELVVPPEYIATGDSEKTLQEQFARTPYAVSFKRKTATFILVTLHVKFGDAALDRLGELQNIARWMRDWANRSNAYSHNLIALGDFNIDRKGSPLWDVFTSTGLTVPDDLDSAPRTIFATQNDPRTDKFYDQIAWFEKADGAKVLNLDYIKGGYFNFLPFVYTDTNLSKTSISFRVSDHFPLWCEFAV